MVILKTKLSLKKYHLNELRGLRSITMAAIWSITFTLESEYTGGRTRAEHNMTNTKYFLIG
jgi:hypothetical protein